MGIFLLSSFLFLVSSFFFLLSSFFFLLSAFFFLLSSIFLLLSSFFFLLSSFFFLLSSFSFLLSPFFFLLSSFFFFFFFFCHCLHPLLIRCRFSSGRRNQTASGFQGFIIMFFQFSVLNGITCIVHVCERAYVYEWGFCLKWGLPAGI